MKTGKFWIVSAPYLTTTLHDDQSSAEDVAQKHRDWFLGGSRPNPERAAQVRIAEHAYPQPVAVTGYDAEQTAAIQDEIQSAQINALRHPASVAVRWSDRLAERGSQKFAVFGGTAYQLLPFDHVDDEDSGSAFDYLPVIVDGQMLMSEHDEGGAGLLYLMRCTKRRGKPQPDPKWIATFMPTAGWLHTAELQQSNAEILDHMAEEIAAGENVLTRCQAGWA